MNEIKPTFWGKESLLANGFENICFLFIFSLFFSRALLGFSGVFLMAFSLFIYYKKPFKTEFKSIHLVFLALYGVYIISVFFNQQNTGVWFGLLIKNSVFVSLSLSFIFYKNITNAIIKKTFLLFISLTTLCLSVSTLNAIINYDTFIIAVSNSKNIQPLIGPSHSQLGVLSVVAFLMGIFLIAKESNKKIKYTLIILISFLFIELHIIAFRFSIISIYSIVILYGFTQLVKTKNYKLFIASLLLIGLCFFGSIYIPSFKNRYKNTIADLETITQNKNPNYQSIAQRWDATRCAVEIIKENLVLGVGAANAEIKMAQQYAKNSYLLIPENRIFIHNQFIYYVLCFGIPFGLFFIIALFYAISKASYQNPLLIWIIIPFLFHMMIENTLEKQITTNAFVFLFLMLANSKNLIKT